jgi:hypothetical protein
VIAGALANEAEIAVFLSYDRYDPYLQNVSSRAIKECHEKVRCDIVRQVGCVAH